MTEIKIPFTKIEVEKYSGPNKPANSEGLTLTITPIVYNEFYEKLQLPLDSVLNKIKFGFIDGAEKEIYENLLDDSKDKFELIFEKEKVDFYVASMESDDRERDDTKIEVNYFAIGSNASLEIFFKPQFAGVVKITSTSQNDNGKNGPTDNGENNNDNGGGNKNNNNNDDTNKKITNLQNQINTLEEKLKNQPSSDNNSADKKRLNQLKAEIEELKKKPKRKGNQGNEESNKNNFPTGLVVGGGIIIVILLMAVIFFWQRSKRR